MKYFVFADMGYNGGILFQYDTLAEANKVYRRMRKEIGKDNTFDGICLIKGNVLKNHGERCLNE